MVENAQGHRTRGTGRVVASSAQGGKKSEPLRFRVILPRTVGEGQGPRGPVLEAAPLQELASAEGDDEDTGITSKVKKEERDGVILDGIPTAVVGATEVDGQVEGNLAVPDAYQQTHDIPRGKKIHDSAKYAVCTSLLDTKVTQAEVLGCGAVEAIHPDWRSQECLRSKSWAGNTKRDRTELVRDAS